MHKTGFKRSAILRASAATAVVLSVPGVAYAQEEPSKATEASESETTPQNDTGANEANEIVVTGFRGVLRNAIREKRDSVIQVDAITAEDIADFPDSNLAESLQRLPGVSIDRDNGDGRGITVRGLGGDFNRTRLNGLEALATAGSNDSGTNPNRSRSFDYNTFASELFSSLKVRKTPEARTDEGSLGATIDLQTGRPFDYKGRAFALSTEGSYGENSKKWNPRLAGLVSTKFLDDSMGLLFSAAWSKSENSINQYRRQSNQADYLYRSSDFVGNENPQRAGFAAPIGTNFGTAITNPEAIALLTGSDPTAYAALYPGAPYNTPGRFDDSLVRIPGLINIEQQNVKNQRLGLTGAWQWQLGDKTRISVDGVYSRFENESSFNQLQTVGLNRNNTNATFNTATSSLPIASARGLYPGLCSPRDETELVAPLDCGNSLYGTTPAFNTALNASNVLSPAILGLGAVVPGGTSPTTANIFSVNPFNLDPYDYYNNPNSVGYIPSTNRLAFRGALIGRPAVEVRDAHVTNGVADYMVLRGVDWRSAVDYTSYVTKFKQVSTQIDHEFSDSLRISIIGGYSKSTNNSVGKLAEFNRMDSPEDFIYDERDGGNMPVYNVGFNAADPNQWQIVKGFSAIRMFKRSVTNDYKQLRGDIEWDVHPEFKVSAGVNARRYQFSTESFGRSSDTVIPTLREAGVTTASVARTIQFGQGLDVPAGTTTSFVVPDLNALDNLFDFTCNCVNKWADWRINNKGGSGANNFSVSEENIGAYLQFDFNTQIFGRDLRGNFGTRYVNTSVESVGRTTAGRPITGTNKYTDWLPSVNLVYEPVDNVIARFGMSKVMARPLLGNLNPTVTSLSIPNTPGTLTGATLTVGNTRLSPFRATNIDASLEWYFAPGGLLSVAYFDKKIASFPQTLVFDSELSDFLDDDAIEALKLQLSPQQVEYINAGGAFSARQFRDAPGGYVRGIEASIQMDLTFLPGFLKNLGFQANYTRIWSELTYILDPGQTAAPVRPAILGSAPFLGVSPQAFNATLYYETKKFRARVSAAQRKGYTTAFPLSSGACSPGLTNAPANPSVAGSLCNSPLINDFAYSKSTLNVDASISWNITDFATLTAEALNLTNQTSNRYQYQDQSVVTNYASTGRIFRVGARVKFK